jgi:hypothetical protein
VRERRGSTMVEFAIIAPVFLLVLFLVFQVAYQQYLTVVLQATVQNIAHEIEVGGAENLTDATFLKTVYCSGANNSGGLLGCNNLYLRIQRFVPATGCTDVYNVTQGTLPVAGSGNNLQLELGLYFNVNGAGQQGKLGPSDCSGTASDFCNAGPAETIILTGIYVSPSLILGLIPGTSYGYNGSSVTAAIASVGFETESFAATTQTPAC